MMMLAQAATSPYALLGSDTLYNGLKDGEVASNLERHPTSLLLISIIRRLYLLHVLVSLFLSLIFSTHFSLTATLFLTPSLSF